MLSFQRLDVYQRAIEFLALVYDIVDALPRGHADRADQLTRAAESVVRNIAEGAGRWSEAMLVTNAAASCSKAWSRC